MNRRKLNALQAMLVEKGHQEDIESESNFLRDITNEEYYWVKNVDELQQVLNEIASSNALANTKEVNKRIKSTFKKKSTTLYSKSKTCLNNEHDKGFECQMREISNTLEGIISNDAKQRKNFEEEDRNEQS